MNFNSLFQLYAMRLEGSIDIDGVRSILFMPDAISYLLTGKEVCEYTILSTSQLMNPETCRIEERLLEPLQIPVEKFPPVVMPGRCSGRNRIVGYSRCSCCRSRYGIGGGGRAGIGK